MGPRQTIDDVLAPLLVHHKEDKHVDVSPGSSDVCCPVLGDVLGGNRICYGAGGTPLWSYGIARL